VYKTFSFKWLLLSFVITLNYKNFTTDITCIGEKINYVDLLTEFVNIAISAPTATHTPRHGTFITNKSEL